MVLGFAGSSSRKTSIPWIAPKSLGEGAFVWRAESTWRDDEKRFFLSHAPSQMPTAYWRTLPPMHSPRLKTRWGVVDRYVLVIAESAPILAVEVCLQLSGFNALQLKFTTFAGTAEQRVLAQRALAYLVSAALILSRADYAHLCAVERDGLAGLPLCQDWGMRRELLSPVLSDVWLKHSLSQPQLAWAAKIAVLEINPQQWWELAIGKEMQRSLGFLHRLINPKPTKTRVNPRLVWLRGLGRMLGRRV